MGKRIRGNKKYNYSKRRERVRPTQCLRVIKTKEWQIHYTDI